MRGSSSKESNQHQGRQEQLKADPKILGHFQKRDPDDQFEDMGQNQARKKQSLLSRLLAPHRFPCVLCSMGMGSFENYTIKFRCSKCSMTFCKEHLYKVDFMKMKQCQHTELIQQTNCSECLEFIDVGKECPCNKEEFENEDQM